MSARNDDAGADGSVRTRLTYTGHAFAHRTVYW